MSNLIKVAVIGAGMMGKIICVPTKAFRELNLSVSMIFLAKMPKRLLKCLELKLLPHWKKWPVL